MQYKRIIMLLLSATLIFTADVFAETTTENSKQQKKPTARQTDKEPVSKPSGRKNTLKEFVPSEEISIDKPVAFPVDI